MRRIRIYNVSAEYYLRETEIRLHQFYIVKGYALPNNGVLLGIEIKKVPYYLNVPVRRVRINAK